MRQMAAKEHPLMHGGKLEKGSQNVRSHHEPVWRAVKDEHTCAGGPLPPTPPDVPVFAEAHADGPEKVSEGAERVRVNHCRVAREGDFLLGSGPPNMIAFREGVRVYVGENGVGSDTDAFEKFFCEQMCALKKKFAELDQAVADGKLTADQADKAKLAAYEASVRRMFKRLGMPTPTFKRMDEGGAWDYANWQLQYNPGFVRGDFGEDHFRSMTWHEMRHAEQSWGGLRYALGRKRRGINPKGQDDALYWVPKRVKRDALRAGTLNDKTKEGRWAKTMADSNFTKQGWDQLGWALQDKPVDLSAHRYPTTPAGGDTGRFIDEQTDPRKPPLRSRPRQCKC